MIRPDAMKALMRWREALFGLAVALLGLLWVLRAFGILQWLGWALIAAGLALAFAGVQRGRFRGAGDGPGVVTIDERRVTYMGPTMGGVADLDLLQRLELHPDGPTWRLVAESGAWLDIPVDAAGAEQLFDLFAALPGVQIETMLARMRAPGTGVHIVWTGPERPITQRLH